MSHSSVERQGIHIEQIREIHSFFLSFFSASWKKSSSFQLKILPERENVPTSAGLSKPNLFFFVPPEFPFLFYFYLFFLNFMAYTYPVSLKYMQEMIIYNWCLFTYQFLKINPFCLFQTTDGSKRERVLLNCLRKLFRKIK